MTQKSTAQSATAKRCPWPGIDDPEYARYHDEEWGVPKTDDRDLFEKIILEGFQAGLSWLTILRKRDNFRDAFDRFDPGRIARYTDKDKARLMANAGIVRNRLKIEATIDNARAYLQLREECSLADLIWDHLDGQSINNTFRDFSEVPAETDISKAISKSLKKRGFRFVGPTTMYAFLQASGFVNDHLISCPRHDACARLQRAVNL